MTKRLGALSPALVVGFGGLLLWELVLGVLQPKGFLLPAPSEIVGSLIDNQAAIVTAVKSTGFIVITGLLFGVIVGVLAALAVSRFRIADETITPLAVAVSAIPIIALAPIFNAWFGLTSPRSNQLVGEICA